MHANTKFISMTAAFFVASGSINIPGNGDLFLQKNRTETVHERLLYSTSWIVQYF